MYRGSKTIYGEAASNANDFGKQLTVLPNTTVNEALGLKLNDVPGRHSVEYYMIGLSYTDLIPNALTLDEVKHKKTDAIVFRPLPFVVRRQDEELTAAAAQSYRLKAGFVKDGISYYGYYGKKIDDTDDMNKNLRVDVANGSPTLDDTALIEFDPLHPSPSKNVDIFADKLTYVTNSRVATIVLSTSEVEDIRKSIDLLYPGKGYIIGEIGLLTGIDINNSLEKAQTAFFVKTNMNVEPAVTQKALKKHIEIGSITSQAIKN